MFNKGVIDHDFSSFDLEITSFTNESIHVPYAFYQQLAEEQYFENPEVDNTTDNKIDGKFSSIDIKRFSNVTKLKIKENNGNYTLGDGGLVFRGRGYCKIYLIINMSDFKKNTALFTLKLHIHGNSSEISLNMNFTEISNEIISFIIVNTLIFLINSLSGNNL